ncbi:MAG: signal recognition particle-docking protein FtsY [Deltaproteobacteria bacterium]|nr:signal recognition particle-docking protein FtsY [Deltaproteobacteria bacterium]
MTKEEKRGFWGRVFGPKRQDEETGLPPNGESNEAGREPAQEPEPEPEIELGPPAEHAEREEPPAEGGLFARLRQGLEKTRQGFVQKVDRVLFGKKTIDAETLDELEEALVTADLGVQTAVKLIQGIQERVERKELGSPEALRSYLKEAVRGILVEDEGHFELGAERPYVVMVVGVNGVGKTTTIGKIASQFRARGCKVILAAADTFRAAAIEQLGIWGERVGAHVVRHQHGSDPAAVAYDAVQAAQAREAELVIIDTAGRLHTKANLMEELKKVKRVIGKAAPGAPHEVLLVVDATTGQNAISQARLFHEAVGVDSIALTKLDGTAKGGVIVGICEELKIPIKFIGIGEKVDDLRPFDARAFVEALF